MALATVYIPTLDGGDRLAGCLRALQAQDTPVEVVVADNGEGQGCREMLERDFPWVTRVGFGRNLGFGTAINRAVAEAGSGHVILLNDDAVAEPGFVSGLLSMAGSAEMVAGVMVEPDGETIDSAGVVVDQTLMGFDYMHGRPLASLEGAPPPLGPTGGGALFRREAFEAVGGFDERIFLYYEDVDLALRMRARGFRCAVAPRARASHGFSETLGARTGRKYAMTGWSRGYLIRIYGISGHPGTLAGALGRELVICLGQLAKDRTLAGLVARIKGWRDAAGEPRKAIPAGATIRMSLRAALAERRRRHSSG